MHHSALFLVALVSVALAAPVNEDLGHPSIQTDPHVITGVHKGLKNSPEESVLELAVSIE